MLALARKNVAGEQDTGSVESVFEQARQVAAEAEALLVDDGWDAPESEPAIVEAEPVAADAGTDESSDNASERQRTLFSWAEFMAGEPDEPKPRGRHEAPTSSLFSSRFRFVPTTAHHHRDGETDSPNRVVRTVRHWPRFTAPMTKTTSLMARPLMTVCDPTIALPCNFSTCIDARHVGSTVPEDRAATDASKPSTRREGAALPGAASMMAHHTPHRLPPLTTFECGLLPSSPCE